ncbi:hypothetical protein GCM10009687_56270 [Asanoa iriomotensis]|uniref:Uncharacterized protein n=1 Tax=Asanoa iriomotensis TaxID=234613 RepID=A0ABQ4CGN8_9ACTN|nr:hypothetical protein Air01nite_77410 [Asanoa iriomotensis]
MAARQHPRTTHRRRLAGSGPTDNGEPTPERTTSTRAGPDARGTSPDPIPATPHTPDDGPAAPPSAGSTPEPDPDGGYADTADDSETMTVIIRPQDFRLPEVLRHIEAGKIVLVIPQPPD